MFALQENDNDDRGEAQSNLDVYFIFLDQAEGAMTIGIPGMSEQSVEAARQRLRAASGDPWRRGAKWL